MQWERVMRRRGKWIFLEKVQVNPVAAVQRTLPAGEMQVLCSARSGVGPRVGIACRLMTWRWGQDGAPCEATVLRL